MGKMTATDEVQLSPRVPRDFRDRLNADAEAAGCSVGALITRMYASHDPTARRHIERSLGRLGAALNDARVPDDTMRAVRAALADLQQAIHAMTP